ncbi:MAG TPA: hypothetical protein DFS52_21935 [Myxococcales bacterium]|jgi:hypothetical protein|nr:hypothetical protein [Myxococcales bacterium]
MRSFMRSLAAVALLGLGACGGPGDPEELAEQIVSYLSEADFEGFSENLVATPQEVLEVCPATTSYTVNLSSHRSRFDDCLKAADFGSVDKVTQVLPTTGLEPSCKAGVEFASEIKVTVATKTSIYTFKIRDALKTENGWKITDTLSCPDR